METLERKNASSTDHFTDTLFAWSLEHISNEDLYKDKVETIPRSFKSVKHYLGSYVHPLLEETRAQLFSSMETLYRAPFAEVVDVQETKPHGTKLYQLRVDYWRNRFSDRSKEPYKTLPGDLLVLSNSKPESLTGLDRAGRIWAMLSVTSIIDEDETEDGFDVSSTFFRVRASKDFESYFDTKSLIYVTYLMNLIPHKRTWKALHMTRYPKILSDVLCTESVVDQQCYSCGAGNESFLNGDTVTSFLISDLNESQKKSILACLHSLHCKNNSFELIWGPPGTGKTKTTATILICLLKMKVRTLVCAPTNVAITEVASRVMKMVTEEAETRASGSSLGDILLFGNKERLKVNDSTQEIYLEHRVRSLADCFGSFGLNHSISAMISFLEDCVSQYQIFVENELIKEKEVEGYQKVVKSLIKYVQERFLLIAEQLQKCISIFCTHIPKSYVSEQNFQNLTFLAEYLDCLESVLFQNYVGSKELEEVFSCSEAVEDPSDSFVDRNSLVSMRRACLSFLRSLEQPLKKMDLPSFRNTEKIKSFCFQRAMLVFCTVSTSFKLHHMEIAPMDVLVIDEAAQLKECESTIPLQLAGLKLAILVGDERQLPATVTSQICKEAAFGRSLFERLGMQGFPKNLLDVQYRMHPSISCFPNSKFYGNLIEDASLVKRKSYEKLYLPGMMFGSYSFLNVIGGREEKDDDRISRKNMVEVAIVLKILQRLHRAWVESQRQVGIGIVSPYAAQVAAIQEKVGKKYDGSMGFSVKVKTVDGFQGGEEDIIIMSTVRSDHSRSIEFISNHQRVNVALTRARHCLWILGSERTLACSQSIWGSLVTDAKNRGCFFNVDDDKELAKTILEVKKELDHFDDLLNADSVLFKNSKWKILFSDNFLKSFKKLKSVRVKKAVLNLLLKLSSGWRPKRAILASGAGNSVEIKKFRVEGFYVMGTIDIRKYSKYIQVLRIWDVTTPEEIPKLTKRLDAIFGKYTDEFIILCNEKYLEGNLEMPKSWSPSTEIVRFKDPSNNELGSDVADSSSDGRTYVENSSVSESLLLMKFYSLSYGVVNHLLSDRDGEELDLPFEVTDEQMEMILFPRSTFILGRSGTGKTTVLTMKLFQKEQLHHKAVIEYEGSAENKISVLRQLFVTVSPKLCDLIKKEVFDLKSFLCGHTSLGGSKSTEWDIIDDEEQFKDIPDSFVDIAHESYPLVVTFHKFLMMLDGSFSKSYFERFVDMSQDHRQASRSVALQTFLRNKEVTYDRFCASYWPRFNTNLTKKIDSSRVFTEIISHIKGGLKVMDSSDLKLSREEYVKLSEGRASSFRSEKREMIYDIFQTYEKMKIERGEFDLADFVVDLHSRIRHERYEGDQMDYVYIDEVQDLTMSQIALFKHICSNIEEGFVFAGDTAQTIARGIDFRFQDIRSLFYNRFLLGSNREHGKRSEKGRVSEILNLSQNFRTHAGILKLSHSIVELLYHFFPHSIDVLKPESSLISGEAPVLLQMGNNENAIVKIFGENANESRNISGFGAEQVILVRDDNARKEISQLVGKQALLLTILECKGLEFQDVLLYNFFGSSPLKQKWRVIYEYMTNMNMFDIESPPNFPKFSESKHNILCSELKQLYVAVTRTRQRLWICENTDLSDPMFDFWKKQCIVQVRELDDSLAQAMQITSSPEEWRSRGIKLFHEKNYEWATVCFERAHDTYWERMSKASGIKAMADTMRSSKPEEANSLLREAAEIFDSIGKSESAAKCYVDLGEFERAGKIYLEKFGESELSRAAECFTLAGRHELAAEAYAKGSFFSECLTVCARGKHFDMGLDFIKEWKQNSEKECGSSTRGKEIEKVEHKFLERCALHYHKANDKNSMMNFVRAFNSMTAAREFLRNLGCFDEIMLLEIESGNFEEAAEMAKLKGDILLSIDLLGKARKFSEASSLIMHYVLGRSLWLPGKGWPLKKFQDKDVLLSQAKLLAENESDDYHNLLRIEADIMSSEDSSLLVIMNQMVTSQMYNSVKGKILSARKLLEAHFSLKPGKFFCKEDLVTDLEKYSENAMFKNEASAESLVYFWDSWKDQIISVLQYLERLHMNEEADEYVLHGDFCLSYLGVWKQFHNSNPVYLLLGSEVDWAWNIEKTSPRNNGTLVSIDSRKLASSAKEYWCSEITSVGIKVLDTLKAVYTHKPVSSLCGCKTLTFIYRVADNLLESEYLKQSHQISRTLGTFITLAVDDFLSYAFPPNPPRSLTLSMIHLRGTELSKKLLTQIVAKSECLWDLSYGKIGGIVMIIMGSGTFDRELFEKVMKGLKWNPPWEAFLGNLCSSSVSEPDLAFRLRVALADTVNINLHAVKDYVSPHCFFYLVENLLNMTASIQGQIITTRSSFVEWLAYREEHSRPHGLTSMPFPHMMKFLENIREFVVYVIKVWLDNINDMIKWIKMSYGHRNVNENISMVLTRMIVIICLLHVNFGKCYGLLDKYLYRKVSAEHLPFEFRSTLISGRGQNFLDVLSKALMKIEDPLVIVILDGAQIPNVTCSHTVVVDMTVNRCKDTILRTLFPKARETSSEVLPIPSTTATPGVEQSPEMIPPMNLEQKCDNRDSGDLEGNESDSPKKSGFCWDVFNELSSLDNEQKIGQTHARKVKENLEICSPFFETQKAPFGTPEDINQFRKMGDELKQLHSALDSSLLGSTPFNEASPVKPLCEQLKWRRPIVEPLLNKFLGQQVIDSDVRDAAEAVVVGSAEQCNQKDCDAFSGEDEEEISKMDRQEVCQTSSGAEAKNAVNKGKKGKAKKQKNKKKNKKR